METRARFSRRFLIGLGTAGVIFLFLIVYFQGKKDILLRDFHGLFEAGIKQVFPCSLTAESVSLLPGGNPSVLRLRLSRVCLGEVNRDRLPPQPGGFLPAKMEIDSVGLDYRFSELLQRKFTCWRQLRIEGGTFFLRGGRPLLSNISGEILPSENGWRWRNLRATLAGVDFLSEGEITFREGECQAEFGLGPRGGFSGGEISRSGERLMAALKAHLLEPGGIRVSLLGKGGSEAGKWQLTGKLTSAGRILHLEAGNGPEEESWWLRLEPEREQIALFTSFSADGCFAGQARVDHAELGDWNVLTRAEFDGKLSLPEEKDWELNGSLATVNTILNYHPFRDLRVEYRLCPEGLEIHRLEFGREYRLSGSLGWEAEPTMDLSVIIKNAPLADLTGAVGGNRFSAEGRVNGCLKLCGPTAEPRIDFSLRGEEGKIGKFEYDWARINFSGNWPVVQSVDSAFKRGEGRYFLEGEMDLEKLGGPEVFNGLKLAGDKKALVWQGWDIIREDSGTELEIKKDVGEEFRVAFKALMTDGEEEDFREGSGMELAYRLGKQRNLKLELKKEEEFLGIEHKVEF